MAHLPTVRHYYAVYMAGRGPLLLTSSFFSSTPPLLHSISPPLLHHTPLLLSGDLLLLLSGDLLLLSGDLLLLSGDLLGSHVDCYRNPGSGSENLG